MDNECLKAPQSFEDLAIIDKQIGDLYTQVFAQHDGTIPLYDLYSEVATKFRYCTRSELRQKALSAIASDNPDHVKIGTNIILANYMRTIMRVVGQYLTSDPDFNNELVQNVLADVRESIPSLNSTKYISQQINNLSKNSANRYISEEFEVPFDWVRRGIYLDVMQAVDTLFASFPHGLDYIKINYYAKELSNSFAIPKSKIKKYIKQRNNQLFQSNSRSINADPTFDATIKTLLNDEIEKILSSLPEMDRLIIERLYFEGKTVKELADELGLSENIIRVKENKIIRRLRHPNRSRILWSYYRQ